jgi:hypothetical protein
MIGLICCSAPIANAMEAQTNSMTLVLYLKGSAEGSNYGHAAFRISGNNYDNLYELSRGRDLPRGKGDGPLKVWENSVEKAIEERVKDGATVEFYKFNTTSEENEAALEHFQGLMKSSTPMEVAIDLESKREVTEVYESKAGYHYLKNNCVTTAIKLFETGTGIKLPINNLGDGLLWHERAVISLEGWPSHTFLPRDLNNILKEHYVDSESTDLKSTDCCIDLYG